MSTDSVRPPMHPPITSDVEQGLADLDEHGVTIHEGFISDDEADAIRDRLEEQAYMERVRGTALVGGPSGATGNYRSTLDHDPIFQGVPSLINKGRIFIELAKNPIAHAYARGVFDPNPWLLWGQNAIITRRGSLEQLLHTDTLMLPQEMATRPVLINCFVCVTDFDEDMGPTGFVLGSHRRPLRYDGDQESPRAIGVAKKGSAIIWDGRTWHGQGEHRSERTRYAIAMSYSLFVFRSGEHYPASLHDAVYESLTDDELRLLGFYDELGGYMNRFGPRRPDDARAPLGQPAWYVPELHREDAG
jgi:ectoine hydroxylase-related dioxygenase (phytanoyl-CoA dioxygenase family)